MFVVDDVPSWDVAISRQLSPGEAAIHLPPKEGVRYMWREGGTKSLCQSASPVSCLGVCPGATKKSV